MVLINNYSTCFCNTQTYQIQIYVLSQQMKEWKKKRESELENALIAIPVPNIATPLTKDVLPSKTNMAL